MTKRWEGELRTLNDIDVPFERIRERSLLGPSGHGAPEPEGSSRQRVVAGVVAFVVFAAAALFAWRALSPAGTRPIVASPEPTIRGAAALAVRCDGNVARVLTPVVSAQSDGLHILPTDVPEGVAIGVWSSGGGGSSWWSGSDGVNDEFVRPVPPGDLKVACDDEPGLVDTQLEEMRRRGMDAQLVDPQGFYIPRLPQCSDVKGILAGGIRVPEVSASYESAEMAIRALLKGVLEGDRVELAGYPDWTIHREYRIIRAGAIIALARPWPNEDSGADGGSTVKIYNVMADVCPQSGISARYPFEH